jgi:putative Ca2+/H+ antiporter (TMEM165/GDT1 family)
MMLHEAFSQEKDESLVHDLEDLQKELEDEKEKEAIENKKIDKENDLKEPLNPKTPNKNKKTNIFTSRWSYVSGLIIAEMGDKSQISAIVLGAINNFYGVLLGTTLAFILCIVMSSITGKELSAKFTHRQLTILGGSMFLLFAAIYFLQVTGIL